MELQDLLFIEIGAFMLIGWIKEEVKSKWQDRKNNFTES